MNGNETEGRSGEGERAESALPIRRLHVSDILAGDREVILVHRNSEYRLRLTTNDKLILTK